MDIFTIALIGVCILCIYCYLRSSKPNDSPYPEVPTSSTLRTLFSAFILPHKLLERSQKAGDIYAYQLGMKIIMLNSFDAVHEAFVNQADVFSGRQNDRFIEKITHNGGVVATDGPVWQQNRRFMLRLMREFGMGRPVGADLITEECESMKALLDRCQGEAVITQDVFSRVTNNVIARLMFGERNGSNDGAEFKKFTQHLNGTFKLRLINILPMVFPWILDVPILFKIFDYFSEIFYNMEGMHDYIRKKIQYQAEALASLEHPPTDVSEASNICEAFLIEQANQEKSNPGQQHSTDWQVIRSMTDLFTAGTETTASTLNWAMLLLAVNPEIQQHVQKEIEEKLGRSRLPVMTDRHLLPYVCAVMDEVMRYSSLVPLNLIHRTTEDTVLMGYRIPANSLIQSNIRGIHNDPKLWSHPSEMYPEHFLSEDGEYRPSKYLIPFSLGKRACLGESLARMEYFIAFVTLMQHFRVRLADPNANIQKILAGTIGIVRHPLPHKIIFSKLDDSH